MSFELGIAQVTKFHPSADRWALERDGHWALMRAYAAMWNIPAASRAMADAIDYEAAIRVWEELKLPRYSRILRAPDARPDPVENSYTP